MIHLTISRNRWNNLLKGMLEVGKGRINQRLSIGYRNDKFEGIEVLFNMLCEELSQRLLHLSFIKPTEFQRYINHFVIITDSEFTITNTCTNFLEQYNLDPYTIKGSSFLKLADPGTASYLTAVYGVGDQTVDTKPKILLLKEDPFAYSIKKMYLEQLFVISLHQIYIDKKYFKPPHETGVAEKNRLLENKRYEEVIERIKTEIDTLPFSKKLALKDIVKNHSINITLLKKLFKQQYQCGVYEYQIKLRMNAAHELIVGGEMPLKKIAADMGYRQYSAFVKYFKRYFNILPKDLRKLSKQQHD